MKRLLATVPLTLATLMLLAGRSCAQCPDPVNYCTAAPNSRGAGAQMAWTGHAIPELANFQLVARGCPANQPLLFYYGAVQAAAPFGNGWLCVGWGGAGLFRFAPIHTNGAGTAVLQVDFLHWPAGGGGPGAWSAGDTWYCQGWYRDPAGGEAHFNLTDGLEVQVCAAGGA